MTRRLDPVVRILRLLGTCLVLLVWTVLSQTVAPDLPSPHRPHASGQAGANVPAVSTDATNEAREV
jgi:hypothetical protein